MLCILLPVGVGWHTLVRLTCGRKLAQAGMAVGCIEAGVGEQGQAQGARAAHLHIFIIIIIIVIGKWCVSSRPSDATEVRRG